MLKDKPPVTTSGFTKGLFTKGNILVNEPGHSPNCMDIKWNFDESIQKRLGSNTRNLVQLGSTAVAGWVLNSSGTLSTGLKSYYKLDEASGFRADSYSTNDLTASGSPMSDSGIRGQAAQLIASSSQYLYKSSLDFTGSGNNMSISTWFYLTATSATEIPLVSKRDVSSVDSYTVLLLHCDSAGVPGYFLDSSPSAHTINTAGNAQIDMTQHKFGDGAGKFDGTVDCLLVDDSADWDFGTGDFTIDFWVRYNIVVDPHYLFSRTFGGDILGIDYNAGKLDLAVGNVSKSNEYWTPSVNTWYHIAAVRSGTNVYLFINGIQSGATGTSSYDVQASVGIGIGANSNGVNPMNGWIDEFRISKGIARWTANFTPPIAPSIPLQNYEYYLYVNTNNYPTFRVSSSGTVHNGTVEATSMGTVNTSTWYNLIAWHTTGSHIGISGNLSVTTAAYTDSIRLGSAPFMLGAVSNGAVYMNGRMDETSFWSKTLSKGEREDLYGGGTANSYSTGQSGYTYGSYDFGASSLRWLMVAAGTGIYASSNMGLTFVTATTTRTQNYQSFERSKNVLIATSDSYDPTLYWAGSVGTYMQVLAPNSAPAVKFAKNYQGYLVLLNQSANKRRFAYEFDSQQLTSAWPNFFDLPSSFDDEITDSFTVNRIYYVSTRYRIFKMSLAGGNPDWQYTIVKEWGYVPRTVKIAFMMDREWAIGMDWNRRLRAFDGYNEIFISNNVEADNGICDFAMNKVSFSGSGLAISNAIFDPIEQEYRLNVAIGVNSQQTTHAILLNARSLAMYPYANQPYQSMCMAESANTQFLLATDRLGYVHILNTSNTDVGVPINDIYDSPFIFNKVPGTVSKGGKLDLFFKPSNTGVIYYQDRADFASSYGANRKKIDIQKDDVTHVYKSIDLPSTHNILQYRLMSSANTTEPWTLTHADLYQQGMGIGAGK